MITSSVVGVEAKYKPIPSVIERNRRLLYHVRTVLEIGAGTGRLVKWFLQNTKVESYIAIEPDRKSVEVLAKIEDPRLTIIPDYWEFVRDSFIDEKFDVLVLWNVLMFVDLTGVHGGDYKHAILKETKYFVNMTKKYILLSFHPVKSGLLKNVEDYREILQEFLKCGCRIVDRKHLNYLLNSPRPRG